MKLLEKSLHRASLWSKILAFELCCGLKHFFLDFEEKELILICFILDIYGFFDLYVSNFITFHLNFSTQFEIIWTEQFNSDIRVVLFFYAAELM